MTQADKAVKRWQLQYGRTRKRVEDFSSQLDAARQAFAQISHDSVADERLDITAVTDAMTQAKKKVRALETALKVATQRDEAAQAALRVAEEQVERELKRELLVSLEDAARAMDAWLDSGAPVVETYHARRKAVQALGDLTINTQLTVADASFKTYLFRTCAPMAGCQTGYAVFQTDPKWSAPWSRMNPQPEMADAPRPVPREPKPIPGWQTGD